MLTVLLTCSMKCTNVSSEQYFRQREPVGTAYESSFSTAFIIRAFSFVADGSGGIYRLKNISKKVIGKQQLELKYAAAISTWA